MHYPRFPTLLIAAIMLLATASVASDGQQPPRLQMSDSERRWTESTEKAKNGEVDILAETDDSDLKSRYVEKPDHTLAYAIGVGSLLLLAGFAYWNRKLSREIDLRVAAEKELKATEEHLRDSQQRLLLHREHTPLAVIEWNTDLEVVSWNPAAERIFGWRAEEVLGKHATQHILPEAIPEDVNKVWHDLLARRGGQRNTNENRTRDGRIILCEWYNTPLVGADGTVIGVASLVDDITERKEAERKLRQSEEKFRRIIDASPIPFALNDDHHNIIYLNPEFTRVFGYDLSDIPTLADWWPRAYPDEGYRRWVMATWQERLERAINNGTAFEPVELTIRCKNGDTRTTLCDAASLGKSLEEGVHLVILYDITERKQTEQELEKHRNHLEEMVAARTAELEEANRELEAFSYSVSHDLRSPLRSIDGFSHALLEDNADQLDETGKDHLRRVRKSAQRMGQLIDDLLSLARVMRHQLDCVDLDLSEMARASIAKLHEFETEREIRFDIQADIHGWGDAQLVEVVLDNLIGNAWKYTSTTENARIGFDAETRDGKTVYRVSDNGVGFNMAYANKLFGSFQRLHKADEFEGTGIGLATVARIIRRHGGEVWGESKLGHGAAFYFTLQPDTDDAVSGNRPISSTMP